MHTVITFYNDNTRSFVDVMEKLAEAKILAEADAEERPAIRLNAAPCPTLEMV